MKNYCFAIVLVFATLLSSFAQSSTDKAHFGIQSGVGWSDMTAAAYSNKTGFVGGLFGSFNLGKQFSIQPELNLQLQRIGYEQLPIVVESKYINLPILVKYRLGLTRFSVFAGPQIGFNLGGAHAISEDSKEKIENYKSINFSGVAGIDYKIALPSKDKSIIIKAQHYTGLTDFVQYFSLVPEDKGYRYSGFMLLVGLEIF